MALLQAGLVTQVPANGDAGYIKDVAIIDEAYSGQAVARSDIHRDAIRLLCGEDSIAVLETHRRITTSAWTFTGADPTAKRATALLHTLKPLEE